MTLFCKFVHACCDESSHAHVETKVGHTVPRWPSLARVAVLPGSAAHGWTNGVETAVHGGPTIHAAAVRLVFL